MATVGQNHINEEENEDYDEDNNSNGDIHYDEGNEDDESFNFAKKENIVSTNLGSSRRYHVQKTHQPRIAVPSGATIQNLESTNNLLIDEISNLINTLETHHEKYKQRRRDLWKEKIDENLHNQDTDLKEAQAKSSQIKAEIENMKKVLSTAYDIEGIVRGEDELK